MGFAAYAVFQDETKNSAFLKMSEKICIELIVNSAELLWDLLLVLISKMKQLSFPQNIWKRSALNTLLIQQIRKQRVFDRGMPSKSILLEKKNKENVLSNHLFSDDFVSTSFVNMEQNLDWARADCVPAWNFRR